MTLNEGMLKSIGEAVLPASPHGSRKPHQWIVLADFPGSSRSRTAPPTQKREDSSAKRAARTPIAAHIFLAAVVIRRTPISPNTDWGARVLRSRDMEGTTACFYAEATILSG
jgi:hypothetical protein